MLSNLFIKIEKGKIIIDDIGGGKEEGIFEFKIIYKF